MDRAPASTPPLLRRFPRTRGDGPTHRRPSRPLTQVSPHTRGWTVAVSVEHPGDLGFPAHAGMDPSGSTGWPRARRFPRTRGDGPPPSTRIGLRGRVSPHTRGWTREDAGEGERDDGFPAHAGMDPSPHRRERRNARFPRTRGDGPVQMADALRLRAVSPHTRGWTLRGVLAGLMQPGFPAHAGMDPRTTRSRAWATGFPRTRGDGPEGSRARSSTSPVSPHTRGWTRHCQRAAWACGGFPAHAGMDRCRRVSG